MNQSTYGLHFFTYMPKNVVGNFILELTDMCTSNFIIGLLALHTLLLNYIWAIMFMANTVKIFTSELLAIQ